MVCKWILDVCKWILDVKQEITRAQLIALEKLENKEDLRRTPTFLTFNLGYLKNFAKAGNF